MTDLWLCTKCADELQKTYRPGRIIRRDVAVDGPRCTKCGSFEVMYVLKG